MAGRCLAALVLTVLLSAGNSLDQNWLTSIVEGVKNQYPLGDTFSLAVNIPQNQDPDGLQQVLQEDAADKVEQSVSQGQVYQGARVVAATQSEAASRVLENIQHFKSSDGNFLLLFSVQSPCGPTCSSAHGDELASTVDYIVQNWGGYAFVFSDVVSDAESQSFKQLSISRLGLDHIFRCYQPDDEAFQCTSCSSGADVMPSCVATNQKSADEGNQVSNDADVRDNGLAVGGQMAEGDAEQASSSQDLEGSSKLRRGGKREGGKVAKGKKRRAKGKTGGKIQRGRKGRKRGKGMKRGKSKKMSKSRKRGKGKKMGKSRKMSKGRKMGGRRRKGGRRRG